MCCHFLMLSLDDYHVYFLQCCILVSIFYH
nr:MAG TPA: hypothetical protein [Caudoviricetes sp.]